MPKCVQCGKECNGEISFNTEHGLNYLCSDKCVKESRLWRWKKYNVPFPIEEAKE